MADTKLEGYEKKDVRKGSRVKIFHPFAVIICPHKPRNQELCVTEANILLLGDGGGGGGDDGNNIDDDDDNDDDDDYDDNGDNCGGHSGGRRRGGGDDDDLTHGLSGANGAKPYPRERFSCRVASSSHESAALRLLQKATPSCLLKVGDKDAAPD